MKFHSHLCNKVLLRQPFGLRVCTLASLFAPNRNPHKEPQTTPRNRLGAFGHGNPISQSTMGRAQAPGEHTPLGLWTACPMQRGKIEEGQRKGRASCSDLRAGVGSSTGRGRLFSVSQELHWEERAEKELGTREKHILSWCYWAIPLPLLPSCSPHPVGQQQQKEGKRERPLLCCGREWCLPITAEYQPSRIRRGDRKQEKR